jgi:hypothetical protein
MPLATAAVEAISQTPFNPHKAVSSVEVSQKGGIAAH